MTPNLFNTLNTLPLLALTHVATAGDLHVDDDGVEYPGAAYSTIQDAVDAAVDGDRILVYPGTYTGTGDEVVSVAMRSLELRGVEVNGQRPVVDGEGERRCLTLEGPNYLEAIQAPTTERLSVHNLDLVHGSTDGDGGGALAQGYVRLDGVRISDCSAEGSGGGLACVLPSISFPQYTSVSLSAVDLDACHADGSGGGISSSDSELSLKCARIEGCQAGGEGGGLFFESRFDDVGLRISSNVVGTGTGTLTSILGNEAKKGGGGIAMSGGAYTKMSGLELHENRAWGNGGGMLLRDTLVQWGDYQVPGVELTRNVAALRPDQSGGNGGGVYLLRTTLYHSSSSWHLFEANFAEGSGGGLHAKDSEVDLWHLIVEENVALNGKCGGFLARDCSTFDLREAYFWGNEGPQGAALHLRGCTSHLQSLDVRHNQATASGAALLVKGASSYTKLSDSFFLNNAPRHVRVLGGTADDGGGNSFH